MNRQPECLSAICAILLFPELLPGQSPSLLTEYSVPNPAAYVDGITAGPDGNIWFTELEASNIGRITPSGVITEYPTPTRGARPIAIKAGPDGALWFVEYAGNKIGRIDTSGVITEYAIPSADSRPYDLALGSDGAFWFTESNFAVNKIGRIAMDGSITEYKTSAGPEGPATITAGPDGAMWFTNFGAAWIQSITTAGVIRANNYPVEFLTHGLVTGPDGALWLVGPTRISRMTTAGVRTDFPVPSSQGGYAVAGRITVGADGALWYTYSEWGRIGRLTTSGVFNEYELPSELLTAIDITAGPDGAVWYTDGRIGRLPTPLKLPVDADTTLMLRFEGNLKGEQGQIALTSTGVKYEEGALEQGVNVTAGNRISYSAANNINASQGTVEFWIKPAWKGSDTSNNYVVSWGTVGGILIGKTGKNMDFVVNRFQQETEVTAPISTWGAGLWQHAAFTWDSTGLRVYLNGALVTSKVLSAPLPAISATSFLLGDDNGNTPANAVIDELRISKRARTASEIKADYLATLGTPVGLALTTRLLPAGIVGNPYSVQLAAIGGIPPYSNWAISSGALPGGLNISPSTGIIAGTPSANGTFNFTVTFKDSAGTTSPPQQLSTTIFAAPFAITSKSIPDGAVGAPYSFQLTAAGGSAPYSNWTVAAGTLPSEFSLNASSGILSGMPTTSGSYQFSVTVRDSTGSSSATRPLSLSIAPRVSVTTSSLNDGSVGTPLSIQLNAGGGLPPYSKWVVSSGTTAPGLALENTGVLSGTPTTAGTFNFSVQVTDAGGVSASAALVQIVNRAATRITLTTSAADPAYGQPLVLSAAVSPAGASGNVTFSDGSTILGTSALSGGTGSLTLSTLAAGSHVLTASYAGDGNYASSTSDTLTAMIRKAATTLTLTSSANPCQFGQNLTLKANVSGDSPTGFVTFYDGVNVLGSVRAAVAAIGFNTILPVAGVRQLRAYYGGDFNYASSATVNVAQTVAAVAGVGFQSPVSSTVGSKPSGLVSIDLNGDGRADLAVANKGDNNVAVLLNNGDGTSQPAATYASGSAPVAIAAGDFNQDGRVDLIVANQGSANVSVLLGNGDGTFSASVNYDSAGAPTAIALADVNGDGRIDIALSTAGGKVSVLLGKGDGTFQTPATFDAASSPGVVVAGDFNGDGRVDLAVVSSPEGSVNVLSGNGDGTFQPPVRNPVGVGAVAIATGDFNGDGKADIAIAVNGDNNVGVLIGNGDGTFQPLATYSAGSGPASIAIGDFDGDGVTDLAVGSGDEVGILLGNGDGSFQPLQTHNAGTAPAVVITGEFNGDGATDLAILNQDGIAILPAILR